MASACWNLPGTFFAFNLYNNLLGKGPDPHFMDGKWRRKRSATTHQCQGLGPRDPDSTADAELLSPANCLPILIKGGKKLVWLVHYCSSVRCGRLCCCTSGLDYINMLLRSVWAKLQALCLLLTSHPFLIACIVEDETWGDLKEARELLARASGNLAWDCRIKYRIPSSLWIAHKQQIHFKHWFIFTSCKLMFCLHVCVSVWGC